jgi:hypothetical protein
MESDVESPEVGDGAADEVERRETEGAAASISIAAYVGVSNPERVEPTQYPQRTFFSMTGQRVSDELAGITSNLREYMNLRNRTQ